MAYLAAAPAALYLVSVLLLKVTSGYPFPLLPVAAPEALPPAALQSLRTAMSLHAGVVRDAAGLATLIDLIDGFEAAHGPAPALITARLIAQSALERCESRGGHFRADHPDTAADARHTRITLSPSPVAMAAE